MPFCSRGILPARAPSSLVRDWQFAICQGGRCRWWPSKFSLKVIGRRFMTPRLVEVRKNVLKLNDELARALRERFRRAGVLVVSLVSSPGSGKTALLETTLRTLAQTHRVADL